MYSKSKLHLKFNKPVSSRGSSADDGFSYFLLVLFTFEVVIVLEA